MDEFVRWILINIVSPLALPLVAVATFCAIFGVKPEPIIKACLDLAASAVVVIFKYSEMAVIALYKWWRSNSSTCGCPGAPSKPSPKSTRRHGNFFHH